ncbi:hypothetical protein YC2023_083378 [Brassica napus]
MYLKNYVGIEVRFMREKYILQDNCGSSKKQSKQYMMVCYIKYPRERNRDDPWVTVTTERPSSGKF